MVTQDDIETLIVWNNLLHSFHDVDFIVAIVVLRSSQSINQVGEVNTSFKLLSIGSTSDRLTGEKVISGPISMLSYSELIFLFICEKLTNNKHVVWPD